MSPDKTVDNQSNIDSPKKPVVSSGGEVQYSDPPDIPMKQRLRRNIKPPSYLRDFVQYIKDVVP